MIFGRINSVLVILIAIGIYFIMQKSQLGDYYAGIKVVLFILAGILAVSGILGLLGV